MGALFGQRDVADAGVPARRAPFGLTVPDDHHQLRCLAHGTVSFSSVMPRSACQTAHGEQQRTARPVSC
jgi:hypothetical protein